MRLKSICKLEDLGVVNYTALLVWTLAPGAERWDVYIVETNLEYLFDRGNILNMFEIQKCWNKIY